jgi:hypothetical protein
VGKNKRFIIFWGFYMGNLRGFLVVLGLVVILFCSGLGAIGLYDRWQISLAAKPLISTVIPADEN